MRDYSCGYLKEENSSGWGFDTNVFERRLEFVKKYSWAIPNDDALDFLVSVSPIVEIGAGTGYWASLIQEKGGTIYPFDIQPYNNAWCDGNHTDVFLGGPESVLNFQDCTLFLCWTPYDDTLASDTLKLYTGDRVVFVGEWDDGCNKDDEFFRILGSDWKLEKRIEIPRFPGVNDELYSLVRISK